MQIDMHYHGTYCMARAAGLGRETCRIIATAAQFVDDNAAAGAVEFKDGARIDSEATAHHPIDARNVGNFDERDQRRVWVPFHFFPGNEGEGYTERLKCRKDSAIAREMIDHYLELSDRSFAAALMGVTAHVYADTFSHYGFSGVSSRGNRVKKDSFVFDQNLDPNIYKYITGKAEKFFEKGTGKAGGLLPNVKRWIRDKVEQLGAAAANDFLGALGHGPVATYPDRPYLIWSFDYEQEELGKSERDNPATFLEGCRALHELFGRFAEKRDDLRADPGRDFGAIAEAVKKVIEVQAHKGDRVEAWKRAAGEGALFAGGGEDILGYDRESWEQDWEGLREHEQSASTLSVPIVQFYQAAAVHRTYVLRDLLPRHGLVVD